MNFIESLKNDFSKIFKDNTNLNYYFAPGRVNLIGEHTDYNGGNVFPCAINFGTYALVRKIKDNKIKVYSKNFPELGIIEFNNKNFNYDSKQDWANYPKGVMATLEKKGYLIKGGLEIFFYGNIPSGAGLSSSASIELVTGTFLNDLFNFNIDKIQMAKICQESENEFIGMNCGIMDQFIISMGKKDNALLLDTNNLIYRYCKLSLNEAALVIVNTNKRRDLIDSKYNERRKECESALADLQKKLNINSLGELTEEDFEKNKIYIKDEVKAKRAKHAVYENQRTLKAVDALEKGDLKKLGELMNNSHISLRDDYEVTGKELDTLVELAWKIDGVYGSRMTGAGFGGCTVSIVKKDKVDTFIEKLGKEYSRIIGYNASFYVVDTSDGAKKIIL